MKNFAIQYYASKNKKRKLPKVFLLVIVIVVLFAGKWIIKSYEAYLQEKVRLSALAQVVSLPEQLPDETLYSIVQYKVETGDTFSKILDKLEFDKNESAKIIAAGKEVYDLNLIKEGDTIYFCYSKDDNTLKKIKYEVSEEEIFIIAKEQDYQASLEKIEYYTLLKTASGIIDQSLYQSAVIDGGLSPRLIVNLAEVFAWDVDFSTEIRQGDSFRAYYEEKHRKDKEKIITGNILAAEFMNDGKQFYAFYYQDPEGETGYFDKEGNSVEKEFLRSPVQYRYISSGYSNNRYHPILKKYMPHQSIDYVAPYGTPVVSIGDGTVVYVGWLGGWGQTVKVKHSESYTTQYGHLSEYGQGISYGARVSQGQVIGKIGLTGYTTGPHLDFTFYKDGYAVDPYKTTYPSAKPVKSDFIEDYFKVKDKLLEKLETVNF